LYDEDTQGSSFLATLIGLRGGAIPSGLNPAALHPKKLVALGLEPAVSPISNRQNVAVTVAPASFGASAGWKHCDTAGWKPALLL